MPRSFCRLALWLAPEIGFNPALDKNGGEEVTTFVTVPDKRDHFRQYFLIELLVLKGRVALKQ